MKKSKILTSVLLSTTILCSINVSTISAMQNDISTWNSKSSLTQSQKTLYTKGQVVIHDNGVYKCKRAHYPHEVFKPSVAPMFWGNLDIREWTVDESLTQNQKIPYKKGKVVLYKGKFYECKRFHYAQPGWNPSASRMFWKNIK